MNLRPDQRIRVFFTKDTRGGVDPKATDATTALRTYFAPGLHYTGSAFDQLIADTPPDVFTAADIVAVSMLSVNVPPRAAHQLLSGEANDLLSEIPSTATVWTSPELLDRGGAAWALWDRVDAYDGCGRTITSKILAAKRPALVPIYDQHVASALGFGTSYWAFWQEAASSDGARDLLELVHSTRRHAGLGDHVSDLRVIDVVVWMIQHGLASAPVS